MQSNFFHQYYEDIVAMNSPFADPVHMYIYMAKEVANNPDKLFATVLDDYAIKTLGIVLYMIKSDHLLPITERNKENDVKNIINYILKYKEWYSIHKNDASVQNAQSTFLLIWDGQLNMYHKELFDLLDL
jgi:hypothetical protein